MYAQNNAFFVHIQINVHKKSFFLCTFLQPAQNYFLFVHIKKYCFKYRENTSEWGALTKKRGRGMDDILIEAAQQQGPEEEMEGTPTEYKM